MQSATLPTLLQLMLCCFPSANTPDTTPDTTPDPIPDTTPDATLDTTPNTTFDTTPNTSFFFILCFIISGGELLGLPRIQAHVLLKISLVLISRETICSIQTFFRSWMSKWGWCGLENSAVECQ